MAKMLRCCVLPAPFGTVGMAFTTSAKACFSADSSRLFGQLTKLSVPLTFGLSLPSSNHRLRGRAWATSPSGEDNDDGSKDMQELLVDLLRLETGKVRVNEFVEDRSKFLAEIAKQANEEYRRIANDARKTMDEAGSKVLDQIDADATGFEEELARARAEMEANDREFDEFEKNVERARSEGLFFKNLFAKPTKPWKARSPEEQEQIKAKAEGVTQDLYQSTKKVAASKFRRAAYGVMIVVLTLSVLEAVSSENVQWPKLIVYAILLLALVVQLTFETIVGRGKGR